MTLDRIDTRKLLLMGLVLFSTLALLLSTHPAHAADISTTMSVADLKAKYAAAGKGGTLVKILIVPGHEPDFGGTEYQGLKERDINVAIANQLASQLSKDPRLNVIVARDTESWNTELASYFSSAWDSIVSFVNTHKQQSSADSQSPQFQAAHSAAPTDVALRLYGITKWANENGVDIAIHVHLNDAGDRVGEGAGSQAGFAVYTPSPIYGNASTSRAFGSSIASELNHYNATSSLAIENLGVVDDQELIALGAYNTASFASVLVEYAYIYESKITSPAVLPIVEKEFANSTYRGVEEFFGSRVSYYDTLQIPHVFRTSPSQGTYSAETYALQVGLHRLHLYPAPGEYYYDCPVEGYMGTCTMNALKAFQKSKGISQTGTLGPQTRRALNAIWAR